MDTTPASGSSTPATSPTGTPCPSTLLRLPLSKLRPLLKQDPDVQLTSADAVFLLARATELFIESLAGCAHQASLDRRTKGGAVGAGGSQLTAADVEEGANRGAGFAFLQSGVMELDFKDIIKGTVDQMDEQDQ